MYMVMFILDDPDRLDAVLDAWASVGVSGITILESCGVYRRRFVRQQVSARYSFEGLGPTREFGNYTLFAIVPNEDVARRCLAVVEELVGDLDGPHTGVLAAWPLALIKGVPLPGGEGG